MDLDKAAKTLRAMLNLTDIGGYAAVKRAIKTGGEAERIATALKAQKRGALKTWLERNGLSKDRIADCRACHEHADLLDSKQPESMREAMRIIREHREDEQEHAPAPAPKPRAGRPPKSPETRAREAMARAIAMWRAAGLPEDEMARLLD